MKLISWNVNGIRALLKKGFLDFLEEQRPDLLLLQEVKANHDQVEYDFAAAGWEVCWNGAQKKGYSGVAILSRTAVTAAHGVQPGVSFDDARGNQLHQSIPRL
jgi:exodeoxyribonuclease-3